MRGSEEAGSIAKRRSGAVWRLDEVAAFAPSATAREAREAAFPGAEVTGGAAVVLVDRVGGHLPWRGDRPPALRKFAGGPELVIQKRWKQWVVEKPKTGKSVCKFGLK